MTITFLSIGLAVAIVVTMVSMTFLLINGRTVIRMLVSRREAGPKVLSEQTWSTPETQIWIALGAFILGTLGTLAAYTAAIATVGVQAP